MKAKRHFLISSAAAVLLASTILSGCNHYMAKSQRTENLSVPVGQAVELCVETGVGSITVTGADVVDCSVAAEIKVKAENQEKARQLAEQVKIETETSDETLRIKVVKPPDLKKRPLEVKFTIVAPKQLKVDCTVNVGSIRVSQMNDRIKASTNVGSVFCKQVVGDITAASNVGSVEVEYAETASGAQNIDITTNVGSIELVTPAELSAQVNASTNVGSVKTEKPITVVGKVGKSINGTIGSGEGKVRLETNVGSIHLK